MQKLYRKLKKEFYSPYYIGNNPNNLNYGLAFIFICFIMFLVASTIPVWGLIWVLGAIVKDKNK